MKDTFRALVSLVALVFIPLISIEISELSPWLARRVVVFSSRLLSDRRRAARYQEEWLDALHVVPGKLTVLFRALGFLVISVPRMNWDFFDARWQIMALHKWNIPIFAYSCYNLYHIPFTFLMRGEQREGAIRANLVLAQIFQALQRGDLNQKIEIIEIIKDIFDNPPRPYMSRTSSRRQRNWLEDITRRVSMQLSAANN